MLTVTCQEGLETHRREDAALIHAMLGIHGAGHAVFMEQHGAAVSRFELLSSTASRVISHSVRFDVVVDVFGGPRGDDSALCALAGAAAEWLWLQDALKRRRLDRNLRKHLRGRAANGCIPKGDWLQLDWFLPPSSYRDVHDAFDAACKWAKGCREAIHQLAARAAGKCSCGSGATLI